MDPRHWCKSSERWALRGARGIFCCYVCDECAAEKRAQFRVDVLDDPDYPADEPIDE